MKNFLLPVLFILLFAVSRSAGASEDLEIPNFSLLGQLGGSECTGFLGNGIPYPEGGLWFGIGLSNRWDGLWGFDYNSMPSQVITMPNHDINLNLNSNPNPVTIIQVQPTDDFALTVNARWYLNDKYDFNRHHFNTAPYLVGGIGMDMVVDPYPKPDKGNFYGNPLDVLLSANVGVGMDFPLWDRKQWFLYAEGMDHFIFWQGLTKVYSIRVGFKIMLDTAHVDPFRGMLQ